MKKKTIVIISLLTFFIGISAYLRIVLPYHHVFTGEWIKFTSIDAYWQMLYIDFMAPNFPEYAREFYRPSLFHRMLSGIIYYAGMGKPSQHLVDTISVYFPAVLGILTIIPVYFLGRAMFGEVAGLISAGLIAVLPGEWLGRSSLGFTDHHVAEVLFSTTAMLFLFLAVKRLTDVKGQIEGRKQVIKYGLLFCVFMAAYWLTWSGAAIFMLITFAYLGLLFILSLKGKQYISIGAGLIYLGLLAFGCFKIESFLPMEKVLTGTMEMAPLSLWSAWANFGALIILIPIALCLLIYKVAMAKEDNKPALLLIIWSMVTFGLMMNFTRFAYYFAVNAALLTGYFISAIWQKAKRRDIVIAVALISLICGTMWVAIAKQATSPQVQYAPPDTWCETLAWVKDNTPEESIILSWWDYGYWIERMGQRNAFVTPGQDPISCMSAASMFLSKADNVSPNRFAYPINADYIILDWAILINKLYGMTIWAGLPYENYITQEGYTDAYSECFMVRLYYEGLPQYEEVYKSGDVKVFRRKD